MKYLVMSTAIESKIPMDPSQAIPMLEQMILPSVKQLKKMEAEKKVLGGGFFSGSRDGAFIIEAESHKEVSEFLHFLPFWIGNRWTITPLDSFETRAGMVNVQIEHLKKIMK